VSNVGLLSKQATKAGQNDRAVRLELAAGLLGANRPGEAAAAVHPLVAADAKLARTEVAAHLSEISRLLEGSDGPNGAAAAEAAWKQAQVALKVAPQAPEYRDTLDIALAVTGLRSGHREGVAQRLAHIDKMPADKLAPHVGAQGASLLLAIGYYLNANSGEAMAVAEKVLGNAPASADNPIQAELRKVAGYGTVARAAKLYQAGQLAQATKLMHGASKFLKAEDPALLTLKAAVAWRSRQEQAAVKIWHSLESVAVPEALLGLGIYYHESGDTGQALGYYRRYVAAGGKDSDRVKHWIDLAQRFARPGSEEKDGQQ
jgi:hypothetical protein